MPLLFQPYRDTECRSTIIDPGGSSRAGYTPMRRQYARFVNELPEPDILWNNTVESNEDFKPYWNTTSIEAVRACRVDYASYFADMQA
jgi:hypothetical protein